MTLFNSDDNDLQIDPTKDYLEELVGEDKKFKTPKDLAKAKVESDAFIEQLKRETAGLRQELNTRLKLEEAIDRITSSQSHSSEQEPKALEQDKGKPAEITPDQIKDLVAKTLSDSETAALRNRNSAYVEKKLQEAFGPTFRRTLKEQAQKLGIGEEFAANLAAEQPNAFLKLFDVVPTQEAPSTAVNAPRNEVNTDALSFKPNGSAKRQSHFEAVRKKEPSRYWSVAFQNEMHKEAQRQGESFFDL